MKRGQTSLEFVALIVFMFVVFFSFFVVIQGQIAETSQRKDEVLLASLNNVVVSQIQLAATSTADFYHSFRTPVLDVEYRYNLTDPQELIVELVEAETSYVTFFQNPVQGFVQPVPGDLNYIYRFDENYIDLDGNPASSPDLAGVYMNINAQECYVAASQGNCVPGFGTLGYPGPDHVPMRNACNEYIEPDPCP